MSNKFKNSIDRKARKLKKQMAKNDLSQVMDDFRHGVLKDENGNQITDQSIAIAMGLRKSGITMRDLRKAELKNKLIVCKSQLEAILYKEIDTDKQIRAEISKLFRVVQNPTDKDIHGLAERMGVDPSDIENVIYAMLRGLIAGGKSQGKQSNFDPKEMEMGMIVEAEHTPDPEMRRKIVSDHLTENEHYYSEGKAKGMFPELVNKALEAVEKKTQNVGGKRVTVHVQPGADMQPKGVRQLQHVYESCRAKGGDKEMCAKQAWATAKRSGYKSEDEDGDFHKMSKRLEDDYEKKNAALPA